jgi:glucose-1-phosphate adenylyltransferase
VNDTLGIIMTGFGDEALGELTRVRARAALPVCGRYRLIDFILSNMVNSGIINVGVPTTSHYRSLMDHLGSGKEWDLSRKLYGLFILPPYLIPGAGLGNSGDIDILNGILDYLERSKQRYVLLSGCDAVYNTDFYALRAFHEASGADITVLTTDSEAYLSSPDRVQFDVDPDGRAADVMLGVNTFSSRRSSMGVYFLEKELLCRCIARCVSRGRHDFVRDVLLHSADELRVFTFPFQGHVGLIDSLPAYYRESMRLLDPAVYARVFDRRTPIYTKVKDQIPTIYGPRACVKNSIIADGCRIDGTVENSILFRGARIAESAVVTDSIVMQNSRIGEEVTIDCTILDKNVSVTEGKLLAGQSSYPVVIGKNASV